MDIASIKQLIKDGHFPEARDQLGQILEQTPDDTVAQMLLAPEMDRCVEHRGKSERTRMWLKHAAMFAIILTFGFRAYCAQESPGDGGNVEEVLPNKSGAIKDKKMPPEPTRTIVFIGKFENKSDARDSVLETISARLRQYIVGARKFEVIDKGYLKEMLRAEALAAAGVLDGEGAEAPESGKIKTAHYCIYGTVLDCGVEKSNTKFRGGELALVKSRVEIVFKITNSETGKIVAQKTVIGSGVDRLSATSESKSSFTRQGMRDAIDEACHMVADALRDIAYPAKVVKVDKKKDITINMTDEEVKEGDVFDVIKIGEPIIDPDTGMSLGFDRDFVGRVVVTHTGPQTSKATPVDGGKLDIEGLDTDKHTYMLSRVSKATLKKEMKEQAKHCAK